MRILSIETSCDETGAAVVEKKDGEQTVRALSNVTATSIALHAKTGGIIPENAAREQIKAIIPVIIQALTESNLAGDAERGTTIERPQRVKRARTSDGGAERQDPRAKWEAARKVFIDDIDAIAVTSGPGLIGSLLVGVETAKTLSFAFEKPLIPVHHLLAHLYANWLVYEPLRAQRSNPKHEITSVVPLSRDDKPGFPFVGLIVSGGHTDLLLFTGLSNYKWLGGTRDDAAGEALDKIGRLLGLSYPAGPEIELRALLINKGPLSSTPLPRGERDRVRVGFKSPLLNSNDFDFSFSGLKTEAARFIQKQHLTERLINEICYALQEAIFAVLIKKTIRAAKLYNVRQIVLGGGVSANQTLRKEFVLQATRHLPKAKIFAPQKSYATDNAAMIGSYALLNYKLVPWSKITAQPDLYFS